MAPPAAVTAFVTKRRPAGRQIASGVPVFIGWGYPPGKAASCKVTSNAALIRRGSLSRHLPFPREGSMDLGHTRPLPVGQDQRPAGGWVCPGLLLSEVVGIRRARFQLSFGG